MKFRLYLYSDKTWIPLRFHW